MARAIEEADRDRLLVPGHERSAVSKQALRAETGENAPAEPVSPETVALRSRLLLELLGQRLPGLPGLLKFSRLGSWLPLALVTGSILVGLMTNVLGPRRQINLLSFPLFLLLAWNLVIYLLMMIVWLGKLVTRRRGRAADDHAGLFGTGRRLAGIALRWALWRGWHGWFGLRQERTGLAAESGIITEALARFGTLWFGHAAPLLIARTRRALHLGAIAMICGAVGGMYLRGFAFEYRATWESTLLDATHVQQLLGVILGPAAAILNAALPDVAPLRGPGGDGDAALWLHLYAVTALVVVILPRAALATHEWWRARRLAASVPLDLADGYFRRMSAEWRGARQRVRIVPYSFRPPSALGDRLRTLLHDYFGVRADITLEESLAYGDEADTILSPACGDAADDAARPARILLAEADEADNTCHVLLFNLAQSPEVEVHGALLDELKSRLATRGGQLLLLIDGTAYRERVDDPARWQERLRAWERIARESGLTVVDLPAAPAEREMTLAAVRTALWPPAEPAPSGAH